MKIKNILEQCKKKLLNEQKKDGHWVYELEADTTIPSEYILMNHFLGIKENDLEKKLAAYIKKNKILMEVGHYFGEENQILVLALKHITL